ncbi:MAG: ferritin family protein [Candidatus Diapherotrites archaeon]
MSKLWRCEICGDPYIGDEAPSNCPFCGAKRKFIKEFNEAKVNFDVELNETDKANVEKALHVELSNASFYFCASKKANETEAQKLFKALGKVEAEHAVIWKKILRLESTQEINENCSGNYKENLQNSHDRETRAIEFYLKAAAESGNERVKEIFNALIEVEKDHLMLSKERGIN